MYMENDVEVIEKLLNEIPMEELEQYILKRKEENEWVKIKWKIKQNPKRA